MSLSAEGCTDTTSIGMPSSESASIPWVETMGESLYLRGTGDIPTTQAWSTRQSDLYCASTQPVNEDDAAKLMAIEQFARDLANKVVNGSLTQRVYLAKCGP